MSRDELIQALIKAREMAHNAPRSIAGQYGNAYARHAEEYLRLLKLANELEVEVDEDE